MTVDEQSPLIVLSGVNKYFGELHVLRDVDLSIARGEVVVVIGPSGSGKSTLCRAINRLEPVNSGTITFDGNVATRDAVKNEGCAANDVASFSFEVCSGTTHTFRVEATDIFGNTGAGQTSWTEGCGL